ncbi:hypothetical protein [Methylobacter sp. sgz302048]|uniref:hypothetical protein n=1 Tax=Methylobacter sp. sgz302048 TaxID=3455945 RepID=UPI003FA0CC68
MRGGRRENAGRKPSLLKKESVVVRVDADLLPIIEKLKQAHAKNDADTLASVASALDGGSAIQTLAFLLRPYV